MNTFAQQTERAGAATAHNDVPVLLLGSVPLADAQAVFSAASHLLGATARRLPDGETGARSNWIAWQRSVFASLGALQPSEHKERAYQLFPPYTLRADRAISDVVFGPLGFAREAIASYAVFKSLKARGEIGRHQRLQIALPTAWAPVYSFISYRWQLEVHASYEQALLHELAQICAAIPHDELTVQWDIATEMSWWERVYPAPYEDAQRGVIDSVLRLLSAVPGSVELGVHLCYGSMNNRHWKEPADTASLAALTNGLARALTRPLDYLHLPVPQNRDDPAYFAPLSALNLPPQTMLYLGLLHLEDGLPGALRRIDAARQFAPRFGIACECGLGRRAPDTINDWLSLHATVARHMNSHTVPPL